MFTAGAGNWFQHIVSVSRGIPYSITPLMMEALFHLSFGMINPTFVTVVYSSCTSFADFVSHS
jgi:hypothetical protein